MRAKPMKSVRTDHESVGQAIDMDNFFSGTDCFPRVTFIPWVVTGCADFPGAFPAGSGDSDVWPADSLRHHEVMVRPWNSQTPGAEAGPI